MKVSELIELLSDLDGACEVKVRSDDGELLDLEDVEDDVFVRGVDEDPEDDDEEDSPAGRPVVVLSTSSP